MTSFDYNERIPNNVGLADDRALQRALEHWQPRFLDWWREMGPEGTSGFDVYLRTAVSVEDVVSAEDIGKMPDKNVADSLSRVPGVTTSAASANVKVNTTVVPGSMSGSTIRSRARSPEAPSTQAASSSAIGTSSMKFFIIQMLPSKVQLLIAR